METDKKKQYEDFRIVREKVLNTFETQENYYEIRLDLADTLIETPIDIEPLTEVMVAIFKAGQKSGKANFQKRIATL